MKFIIPREAISKRGSCSHVPPSSHVIFGGLRSGFESTFLKPLLRSVILVAIALATVIGAHPVKASAGELNPFIRLRCYVPTTSGLARAIRRSVELDLARDARYVRARVYVRFRRVSRPPSFPAHVDEVFDDLIVAPMGEYRYAVTGAPTLSTCAVWYDVNVRVTVTRVADVFFDDSFDDGFDNDYYGGYGCRYSSDCNDRIERISQSYTSRLELPGILVG